MNIRMPRELSKELLSIQDSYLQEEIAEKGIVTLADVPSIKEQYGSLQPHADKISLWQGDITRLKVGPIVYGKLNDALRRDLRNCYENVLKYCVENEIKSVAFCCISTGEFHFPNDEAAKIAYETVTEFLNTHDNFMERIIFNVFKDNDREIYQNVLKLK